MTSPEDNEVTKRLREKAKELLETGKVKYIIGYGKSSDDLRCKPIFIDDAADVDKLVWTPVCQNNLTVYLIEEHRKVKAQEALHARKRGPEPDKRPVGVVVKGCDSRALVQLINENVIGRDEMFVLGVPCTGIVDPKKAMMILFRTGGLDLAKQMEEVLLDKCKECEYPNPVLYDEIFGDKVAPDCVERVPDELDDMSLEERWEFWQNEFSRCIRCYACRNVCPMCYCEECVCDPTDLSLSPFTSAKDKAERPDWIEREPALSENLFFHLIRAFHMIGRCIDCGECERVCPMGIKLRKITRKMNKETDEKFSCKAGIEIDPEKKPLFAVADDKNQGEIL